MPRKRVLTFSLPEFQKSEGKLILQSMSEFCCSHPLVSIVYSVKQSGSASISRAFDFVSAKLVSFICMTIVFSRCCLFDGISMDMHGIHCILCV